MPFASHTFQTVLAHLYALLVMMKQKKTLSSRDFVSGDPFKTPQTP